VYLHVSFDSHFTDGPSRAFSVNRVGVLDALDFLSLQTGTFWLVLDATTILVAPDNQAVRRSVEPMLEKVIRLNNTPTVVGAVELVTVPRTLLNVRDVAATDKGIAINDVAEKLTLAEKIVAKLDR
jgi:hypothetical protein